MILEPFRRKKKEKVSSHLCTGVQRQKGKRKQINAFQGRKKNQRWGRVGEKKKPSPNKRYGTPSREIKKGAATRSTGSVDAEPC